MSYELTFEEILKKTLVENNKGMFQGENFQKGCYLMLSDFDESLMLYEYKDKDSFTSTMLGNPVISKGLITQKYREVFNRYELFN